MTAWGYIALLMAIFLWPWPAQYSACADEQVLQDFTDVRLESLKLAAVPEKKDEKTGFIIGGKNAMSVITRLLEFNGLTIAELEREMRPGAASAAGFLGADEDLLQVLASDNELVTKTLGRTHQELALHLRILAAIGGKQREPFLYHGRRFKVRFIYSRGYQDSPFRDGTRASSEAIIENLASGKELKYSLLVPDMIERYGFYEGKGTSYRVDPKDIVTVLDFLQVKS